VKRTDVLLAMGSPTLALVTEEALLKEGLSVETVTNGIDAVTAAFSGKPRCILCGQILPGMDGLKVCRFLSTVYSSKEIPVIISVTDLNPRLQRMAMSASAVAVVDYSTPIDQIVDLVRHHMSSVRSSAIRSGFSVSRDRILLMTADSLEDSLESVETVVNLASELCCVTSVAEASRKAVLSILVGLGFQRAWIGVLNRSAGTVEAVAFRGRGITGESIKLSGAAGYLTVDKAVTEGIQVVSWSSEFRDGRETWLGSINYIDTPITVGGSVYGIIRCDNGISRRLPSDSSLRVLGMLAGELSSFVRYLEAQSRLEESRSMFEQMLSRRSARAYIVSDKGVVTEVYGGTGDIPCVESVVCGIDVSTLLSAVPSSSRETILKAVSEKRNLEVGVVTCEEGYAAFSLMKKKSGEMILIVSDRTQFGNMERSIKNLEFETDTISSLAADLTSLVDPGDICRTMLRTLEVFYPDEAIAILAAGEVPSSLVPDRLIVHAVSGAGFKDTAVLPGASIPVDRDSPEPGIVVEAVRTGRIINVPDVLQTDMFMRLLPDIRSELTIPMFSRGRIVGVIDLESTQVNRFHNNDVRRLNNIVGFSAGVLETALQQTELIKQARRDRLTGLYNMTFFEERYPEEFERADRYDYSFSLIMMDIDDFKHYNDSFGHPMGNALLRKVTKAMSNALRDVDILVRYGGEEFVCILPLTDKQVAEDVAERIRRRVVEASESIMNSAEQPRGVISLSLGVATFPVDSREKDELLEIADQRMYRAKRAGKNRVCCN
jgi:diguanylate cyclase (GGDEF)-like protein